MTQPMWRGCCDFAQHDDCVSSRRVCCNFAQRDDSVKRIRYEVLEVQLMHMRFVCRRFGWMRCERVRRRSAFRLLA